MPPKRKDTNALNNLISIRDQLDDLYLPLMRHLKDDTAELSSASEKDIARFQRSIQDIHALLEAHRPKPTVPVTEREHTMPDIETPGDTAASQPKPKRPRDKFVDFLILEAFAHQTGYGHPIGQTTLLNLCQAYNPDIQKQPLVARLSRHRNAKKWLEWSDPEDLHITKKGVAERERLRSLAHRDGKIDDIQTALKTGLGIDITVAKITPQKKPD